MRVEGRTDGMCSDVSRPHLSYTLKHLLLPVIHVLPPEEDKRTQLHTGTYKSRNDRAKSCSCAEPLHYEDGCGSGGVAPRILNFVTKWR